MRQNTKHYAKDMKPEIRLLGIDDCPFQPGDKTVKIIGTFFRGGQWLDGVCSTDVEVDGDDATYQILEMLKRSKFTPQLQAILLDGIAFGGFNVVNIESLAKRSGIPVVVVVRKMPDFQTLEATLKKLGMERKYQLMEKAGVPKEVKIRLGAGDLTALNSAAAEMQENAEKQEKEEKQKKKRQKKQGKEQQKGQEKERQKGQNGSVYIQAAGIGFREAESILKLSCTRSYIPEPVRAAHLIAAGITMGESKGRA